jgi:dipeptidyl aminopeptidase/acylaminoacyl peptidase
MRRVVLIGALLVGLAAVLGGAGASMSATTQPNRVLWLNPASPGALVEYSIDSDGTGRTQISDFGPQVDPTRVGNPWSFNTLSRSPNGRLFSIGSLYVGSPSVGYPNTTMGLTQVADGVNVLNPDFANLTPTFSPDSNWLAFSVGKCDTSAACSSQCQFNCLASYVYVVKTDGTGLHQVTSSGTSPSWSADGKWLTYQGFVGDGDFGTPSGIYVIRRDGTGRGWIADGNDPVFAPRGNLVAYRCGGHPDLAGWGLGIVPRPDLCVVRRDGTGRRIVAVSPTRRFFPNFLWSPDATKIAYVEFPARGNYSRLVVIDVSGGKPVTVVRAKQLEFPIAWSPDSRKIVFETQNVSQDVGLTDMVYVGAIATHRSTFVTDARVTRNDAEWTSKTTLTYLTFVH